MVRSTLCLACLAVELRGRLCFQRPHSGTDPSSFKPLRKAENSASGAPASVFLVQGRVPRDTLAARLKPAA